MSDLQQKVTQRAYECALAGLNVNDVMQKLQNIFVIKPHYSGDPEAAISTQIAFEIANKAVQEIASANVNTTAVAIADAPVAPEWEQPQHEEVNLATADPATLGLNEFNDDDLNLINAIELAKERKTHEGQNPDPLTSVPTELKAKPNWVRWKLEQVNGRLTKVPYQLNGDKASSTDPATWNTYEAIVTGAAIDETQGIGIMTDGSFVGFDLDGCRNPATGEIKEWAKRIIDLLGSYCEVTPSGTGVRVYALGELPPGARRFSMAVSAGFGNKVGIETYSEQRYFTITGNRFGETSTLQSSNVLPAYELCRTISREFPSEKRKGVTSFQSSDSDNSSVSFDSGTGVFTSKLAVLMYGKITSAHPFVIEGEQGSKVTAPSQSEADMSLVTLLAMKHGENAEAIDSDFRESALYRPKWDRLAEKTIQKAIKSAGEINSQTSSQMSVTAPATAQATADVAVAASTAALAVAPITVPHSEEIIPPFDPTVITGIYKKIVDLVCRGTTIPPQFVFLAAKVFLGARMAGKVTFENIEKSPCYYGAAIAEKGIGKGLAWRRLMENLFKTTGIIDCPVEIINSVDSGAGLRDTFLELPDGRPIICYIDEVTSLGHTGGDKKQPEIVDRIIELANTTSLSRTLATKKNQKAHRTKDGVYLSLYMCGQNGEVFMSSFAGRTKLGLYDRFYPEYSDPIEAGDLPEISSGEAYRLLEEINNLKFSGRMIMALETKQKLTDYWKNQPEKVRKNPRFKTYLTVDMYMAAFGRGSKVAELEDLDVAIRIFERQLIIRNVHFTEEVPSKVGFYLSKLKVMTEQMRRRLIAGEPIAAVAKSVRDLQTDTRAYANNELDIFDKAWGHWKSQMATTKVKATNGHSYEKWVPMPNENETWAPPPQ